MQSLDSESLRAINDLITQPLQRAVSESIKAGHDRLASAIEVVGKDLAEHIAATATKAAHDALEVREMERTIEAQSERISHLERFKVQLAVVFSILTVLGGLCVDWIKDFFRSGK